METIRIGIVDDHKMIRKSLAMLVDSFPDFEIIFEAGNGRELLDHLQHETVDVVLLDLQMPEMDGFQACRHLHKDYPEVKILILTEKDRRECVAEVFESGAHGYLLKASEPEELATAIRKVYQDDYYFTHALGSLLKESISGRFSRMHQQHELTERELEILKLAAMEFSSAQIGDKLCINVRTVETHRKRIMEKTGTRNFLGSVMFALRHNLIALENLR